MAILVACLAALVAGAAFARGRPSPWRDAALAAIAGAGLAALVSGLAGGDEPGLGLGLGVVVAALLARLARSGRETVPAVAVLLGLLGLRLGVAAGGWLPLHPDEAQYWDWSRTPDLAYLSKPGGIAWLIRGWTALAGDGLAALRLLGVALAAATMTLVWRTARTACGDRGIAWSAAALAALLPLHACTAGLVATDAPLLLCWAALLAVLLRTPAAGAPPAWWHGPVLGLLLAAGVNAKYAMLYAPLALAAAAALPQVRAWLRTPAPWIALALGCCGLLPLLLWNLANGQLGWLHLAGQAGVDRAWKLQPLRPLEYLAGQVAVGLPASLLLPWAVAWAWRGRLQRPAAWLLACAALTPLAALLAASLLGKVQANWPAMAWIPAAVLAAWWLHAAAGTRARRIAICGAIVAAAGAIAVAAAPTLRQRWPDIPPSVPERKLAGYAEVAAEVDRLVALQPERTCTLTGAYDLAAELAWHNRHLPRPVCARFGRRASQYDLWPGLDGGQAGWDAVWAQELDRADRLDGDLRDRLPRGLAADFASLDQPRLVRIAHGYRTWRTFLVVRLRGFDGALDCADQPPTTPKYSR